VVLLDMSMPGADGLETAHFLGQEMPEIKIVVMSAYDRGNCCRALSKRARMPVWTRPASRQSIGHYQQPFQEIRTLNCEKTV